MDTVYFQSWQVKPNLDYNNTFLIDLAPYGIPFGAKLIGKIDCITERNKLVKKTNQCW